MRGSRITSAVSSQTNPLRSAGQYTRNVAAMMMKIATVRGWRFKGAMMESLGVRIKRTLAFMVASLALVSGSYGAELDGSVKQLVVSIAPGWNSMTGRLQCFDRTAAGWTANGPAWPVLYGKNGLAWGRGELGTSEPGIHKAERDGRAPAGVFRIGTIYTYDSALPEGAKFPFHTVTNVDAWVDDVNSPDYNRHVTIDPA